MRFLIKVDELWFVTITIFGRSEGWSLSHQIRKIPTSDGRYFPAPPEDERTREHLQKCALCRAEDTGMISTIYESIRDRRPVEDGVDQFGHYLFETLLGEDNWKKIRRVAEEEREYTIELALAWSEGERNLGRLPWEMMRSKENFLIAGSGRATVAITRLVTGVERTPRQMLTPPRMLFIVGTTLDDPVVKPGAERMMLLRKLKCDGFSIHSRVIENATRNDITAAIKSFKPDVVQFICHGNIDESNGKAYLELMLTGEEEEEYPTGEQIAELLRGDGEFPPIVVLSACHSATEGGVGYLQGPHVTAPLAAKMVQGGVPIVIGMAGQISNYACRIFTSRFGVALMKGEPLIAAMALARRATFAEGQPPRESVDWALPVLYLAEKIDPEYVPVQRGQINPTEQVQTWIKQYNVERNPVFCGREEFFSEYYKFFGRENKVQVLAIEAPQNGSGYGKTRLLQELTIQALRDGHVPCLLSAEDMNWAPPSNVAQLGQLLSEAIFNVRRIFKLGPPRNSQLELLESFSSEQLRTNRDLFDPYIYHMLNNRGELPTSPKVVAMAIQQDLVQLTRDVREKVPLIQQTRGRVIVLLDAVERYHQVIAELCNRELGPYALDSYGMGDDEEIVPVVLAYSKPSTPTNLQKLFEEIDPVWLERRPLDAFRRKGEDLLAYVTLLLHYEDEEGKARPLVVQEIGRDEQTLKKYWGAAHLAMKGIPGVIVNGGLHDFVEYDREEWGLLTQADDTTSWRTFMELMEQQRIGG